MKQRKRLLEFKVNHQLSHSGPSQAPTRQQKFQITAAIEPETQPTAMRPKFIRILPGKGVKEKFVSMITVWHHEACSLILT